MRRLLAAAALAILCATAAACGSDNGNPSGGGATSAPANKAAAAGDNTKQVCADAEKVVTDSTAKFSQELTKILTDAASGDPSADKAAVNSVKGMFNEWAAGLREQAGRASDDELKTALNDAADGIEKAASEIKSRADLQQADKLLDAPELTRANEQLDKICG